MSKVGEQLRVAREAAGLSLAQMARRTCYGKSYLGNVETGKRRATPDVVLAYERALGDEMQRRGLLTGLAASVVAPAAVGALIHRGFQAALDGTGAADKWQERAQRYGQDYMVTGAAELQAILAGDLVVLQQHLETPALWGAAARMLTVYGKTTPGAREAARWYRLAAVAADRSGDIPTRVWVRGRSALALAYEGAGLSTATSMAEQALGLSDRPSLGSLNAHMALAHAAVHRGDHTTALEHLEDGRRVFDQAGSDEQVSDFAVPEWRMETFTSMLLSRMGHPQAANAQDAADRARPDTLPRFATHIQLHRGLMMVRAGDVASGVAYAQAALEALPPERHSLSLRLMLTEIEQTANMQRVA
jgi:transcriptional regulator with XRE-family HTH domain